MKEENELEVVSRYDKNKNDNEGKIFRSDKNKPNRRSYLNSGRPKLESVSSHEKFDV